MALASIHKISLLGLRSQKKEVTKVLQDFGSLQVVPSKQKQKNTSFEETKKDIDYELARLDFLISFLSSSDQDYRADYPYVDGKYLLTEDQKQICAAQYDATTVDICRNIETQVVEYDNEIKKLKSEHSLLSAFPTLGVELHDLEDTATLTQKTGSIFVQDIDEFRSAISAVSQYTSVSEMPQKGMKQCLHIVYLKEDDAKMQEVLSEFSFQDMVLPRRRGTVSEELERITRRIVKVESLLAEEKAKVSGLMTQLLPAMVRYDMYYKQAQRIHTKSDYHLYDYTFSVDAFIETKKQDQLLQIFKDNSLTVVVENIALEEGENPPVKMENNALWKPLEGVTKLYGIPGHNDMDPTPLMGIFFLTFFGLCLTDTAYGLFIMLITGSILLFKKHIGSVLKWMLKLFFAAGAFTALLGMIYSGWLGLTPADLPGPLGTFAQKIAMIDPMTDAYLMLGISFGLGIIHVLFGVFIAMLRALKAKRFMDAIADFLVWLYFIPVLLLYALAATDAYLPQYTELFLNLAYVGVFLVFLAGTRGASWVMKIPSGILNLYNLVSYGSDVLSYSRLLALGLATGIIAMAVNEIALLPITDADGVVHWTSFSVIFTVMILIFGHLFNLALNMLGAYIHSARLQFVEFFGKFLDGGGVEFKPFDSSGKYTDLIKK